VGAGEVESPRTGLVHVSETQETLQIGDIERILLHRGRNLLLDGGVRSKTGGSSYLTVREGDALGRQFFLYDHPLHGRCLHPLALLEHVALIGIVALDPAPGTLTLFSRLRRGTWTGSIREGETLTSRIEGRRAPKPFARFTATACGDGDRPVLSCDIMAFVLPTMDLPVQDSAGTERLPARDPGQIATRFPGRNPDFVFVDRPLELDLDRLSGRFWYTYRADHLLTESHFPGKPVMMGITQILAIVDAAQWLASELQLADGSEIQVKGTLSHVGGPVVCEVGKLVLQSLGNGHDPAVTLKAIKSVAFRNVVIPPAPLQIDVQFTTQRQD
jgi:3-hydroxymyristoyl/3-hydroxydecanoyl-(acyl carrier protein) dehydratase